MTRGVSLLSMALIVVAPAAAAQGAAGADEAAAPPAYHLRQGAIARSRIVALGRDMVVEGEARQDAVVLNGTIRLAGRVGGDVIVIGGDALLRATARVDGDVFVLGGRLETAPGAAIRGRSIAYPDAAAIWLSLIEGPSMGLPAHSAVVLGARLALLAFWAFLVLLLFSIGRRELVSTSESIRLEPFRNFFLGLVGVAAMVLTALFFSAFSGMLLGVPLLILVVVVALVLRFWGMVALFHALG
ncbi:MAG: polymer-forming cytoskeletal protein, partial [bacterium]|nr:polymer-forming cytoskeletal protein [bacterium]